MRVDSHRQRLFTIAAQWAILLFSVAASFGRQPPTTFENCVLVMNRFGDGDSFHVTAKGKEYIFRLYFVDAPETDAEYPNRVKEQAKYFGVTDAQALQLGELAKQFSREKLSRPFIVRTRWEDARGDSRQRRFYAVVQTSNGDLGEQLVENGLARVYGRAGQPGEMATVTGEWEKLRRLEQKARSEKVGAWGAPTGRLTTRATNAESARGVDPFDAFFHPEKQATPVPSPTQISQGSTLAATDRFKPAGHRATTGLAGKLDVNTASKAELDQVPGIGPTLAAAIMAARPFARANDLKRVKGVGDKKYQDIRPYFR